MADAIATPLDGLLESLSQCLDAESARRIVEFHIDSKIQASIDKLAEKANEGLLTEDERSRYEAAINAADFVALLRLKALKRLGPSPA
jgi:hypothetical protein